MLITVQLNAVSNTEAPVSGSELETELLFSSEALRGRILKASGAINNITGSKDMLPLVLTSYLLLCADAGLYCRRHTLVLMVPGHCQQPGSN